MIYAFGDCELDSERYELRRAGERQHVEPQVFDVLAYLIAHRDRVVAREELLAQVWGHTFVSEATLSSRLMAARKAIGDSGRAQALIRTVRGRGYEFVGAVEEAAPAAIPITTPSGLSADAPKPIGRETELAHLSRLLEAAVAGEREFVLVTGEAGVGKTTLVERFIADAASDAPLLVASGRCLEQGGAVEPYMPILEALERVCRQPGGEQVTATLARLAPTWVAQMPGVVDERGLEEARTRSAGARPERMLREMAAALETLASAMPVALVLDDVHWADSSTLALLAHIARRDDPARLLIIGATRPIAGGPVDELRRELRPRGKCVELAVPLLAPEAVGAYLAEHCPGAESLAALIHGRTEGNPLFIDALLRYWVETGALGHDDGSWQVRKGERELTQEVPGTLRELLEQDIERLPDEDQRALEVASAVGAEFSAAAVAAGVGLDLESVEARCAELARRGRFLRDRGAERWPDGTVAASFGFVHDLHRQVLYERIPAGQRARLHGEIAGRLEAGYGAEAPRRAAELAAHYLEAGSPESAVRYLHLAAEQALARAAHRDAVADLTTAVDLVARTPDLRDRDQQELSLQAALAGALAATEGWSSVAAERAYRRGLELARALGDDRSIATLLYELASLHEYQGDYPGSEALIDEALRVEGADRDAGRLLEAHELMACSLFHQGSFEAAIAQADRGLELQRDDRRHPALAFHGEDPAVSCNDWAGLALWCLGYPDQALERITAALELAAEAGREYGLANAHLHATRLRQLRREPERALEHAEATVALARERGFAYQGAAGSILLGWARAILGEPEAGIKSMREGLAAHSASGAAMDRPYFLALLAEGLGASGRAADGMAELTDALHLLEGDRAFFYEAELHRLRGALELEGGHGHGSDDAASSFRRALEVASRQGARSLELRAASSLARLLRERGAATDAVEVLREPCEWFAETLETADLAEARLLLAELEQGTAGAARH